MRICDRCKEQAYDDVTFGIEDQKFDVCEECKLDIIEFITTKEEKRPILSLRKNKEKTIN